MENKVLANGVSIPAIGLGTWKINDKEEVHHVLGDAFECGYRLIDTASAYSNEMAIGKALRDLCIPRDQIFIQDKLWVSCYGYEEAKEACRKSLRKLKTDYLDAYLMHWPAAPQSHENWEEINRETWRGMESLYKEGLVRSIGVCNFQELQLQKLLETAEIAPHIYQFEYHPGMPQVQLVDYFKMTGGLLQASSPLGNGRILQNEDLKRIAKEKGVSTAQLCLKWELKHGFVVIPKTVRKERLIENIQLDDFDLNQEEMLILDQIPFCGGLVTNDEVTIFNA